MDLSLTRGEDISVKDRVGFKCQGDNLQEIPDGISEGLGITFPEVHRSSREMAILARELRRYTNNTMAILPFCTTVEAEAFGGKIKLGDNKVGPRVENYLFGSIEELEKIREIDLSKGRIKEVLDCIEMLSRDKEIVSLNVEGPFTIAASLIEPRIFYRGIRRERAIIDKFLRVLEVSIEKYIIEGARRGAKIISYGDPVGTIDIVGPKIFEELSGRSTYNILKSLENKLEGTIIHICGKTSTPLEGIGLFKTRRIEFQGGFTYGEAIMRVMEDMKDIKFIGHSCIKRTRYSMMKPRVWVIELN